MTTKTNMNNSSNTKPKQNAQKKRLKIPKLEIFRKPLTWYIFMLLGLAGLVWELADIANLYFRFGVVTEFLISIPSQLAVPALSVCFPYVELANRTLLIRKWPELSNVSTLVLSDLDHKMTIEDIFEMTPEARGLFVNCYYRKQTSYQVFKSIGDECLKIFSITKYFSKKFGKATPRIIANNNNKFSSSEQQLMCYQFNLTADGSEPFYFDYIQNSFESPGLFFEVDLDKALFDNVDSIQMIIHDQGLKPRGNKQFPIPYHRPTSSIILNGRNHTLRDDYFAISYSKYLTTLLEKPYATNCQDYTKVPAYDSQEHCFDNCVTNATMDLIRKAPFTAVQLEPLPVLHVSVADNENESFARDVTVIKNKCAANCNQANCLDVVYVTKYIRSKSYENFAFRVYVPNEPTVQSIYKPKLSPTEFQVYALGCFGIWFGLSFFNLIIAQQWCEKWLLARKEKMLRIAKRHATRLVTRK